MQCGLRLLNFSLVTVWLKEYNVSLKDFDKHDVIVLDGGEKNLYGIKATISGEIIFSYTTKNIEKGFYIK